MAETLDSGHVITDEDVDTARLILDLDRALGRTSDPLTRRVAQTPTDRVRSLLGETDSANGHPVDRADSLAQVITSPEHTAQLAREVVDELPDLDPSDKRRVTGQVEGVLRRRLRALVAKTDSSS
jgi:hypothetical protein